MSTSSKTRLPISSPSANTFFSASMIRASSPPEATFWMGLSASPRLADMRNWISSTPVSSIPASPPLGANSTSKRTLGISSWRSSSCTRSLRDWAEVCLAWDRACPRFRASFSALPSSFSRRAMVSSAYWI